MMLMAYFLFKPIYILHVLSQCLFLKVSHLFSQCVGLLGSVCADRLELLALRDEKKNKDIKQMGKQEICNNVRENKKYEKRVSN